MARKKPIFYAGSRITRDNRVLSHWDEERVLEIWTKMTAPQTITNKTKIDKALIKSIANEIGYNVSRDDYTKARFFSQLKNIMFRVRRAAPPPAAPPLAQQRGKPKPKPKPVTTIAKPAVEEPDIVTISSGEENETQNATSKDDVVPGGDSSALAAFLKARETPRAKLWSDLMTEYENKY